MKKVTIKYGKAYKKIMVMEDWEAAKFFNETLMSSPMTTIFETSGQEIDSILVEEVEK